MAVLIKFISQYFYKNNKIVWSNLFIVCFLVSKKLSNFRCQFTTSLIINDKEFKSTK